MTTRLEVLIEELHRLHRGRGLQAPDVVSKIGPTLASVIFEDRPADEAIGRYLLRQKLEVAAGTLAPDLQQVFLAGMAISHDQATLTERLNAAGEAQERLLRTMKRRLQLADRAVAQILDRSSRRSEDLNPFAARGWYVERMESYALVDNRPRFESTRTIRCTHERLTELHESFSVPSPPGTDSEPDVRVEAIEGCERVEIDRFSKSTWRLHVRLSRSLVIGDSHRVGIAVTWPSQDYIRPYNVMVPVRETQSFKAGLEFADTRTQFEIWQYDGVPPAAIDDASPNATLREVKLGESVVMDWSTVRRGLAYGIGWRKAPTL